MYQRDRILSVDVGTSSVKAAVFDGQATQVKTASVGYPLMQPKLGFVEQDPKTVLESVHQAIRKVLMDIDEYPKILVFGTAMHAIMAVDEANRPLTSLVTWADQRAQTIAAELRSQPMGLELYRSSGTPIHAMSPLIKLAWFRKNCPDIFQRAKIWSDLKALILWDFVGKWVIDESLASATGLYNPFTRDWDETALKWCGITRDKLPQIVKTTANLGKIGREIALALGLPQDTIVIAGASDGALANLGVGAVHKGSVAISIGTSGAVRETVTEPILDPAGRLFCYVVDDNHYIVGGPINNGGILLRWLGGILSNKGTQSTELASEGQFIQAFYEELNQEAAKIPAGSDGIFCLPYLTGERAPLWREDVSGSFWGLKLTHTRGHLIRATLEGICYQLNSVVELLTNLTGNIKEIRGTGGFTESPVWLEILAGVLGFELAIPEYTHGSIMGGALLAWYALGQIQSLEKAAELVPLSRRFHPKHSIVQRYAHGYTLFKQLVNISELEFSKLQEFAHGGIIK